MLVTPCGRVTFVRLLQPENAYAPMLITLPGIVMLVRLEQELNAEFPMLVTPSGTVTVPFIAPHAAAIRTFPESIKNKPSGLENLPIKDIKEVQHEKAAVPMLVTLSGIVM